MEEMPIHWVLLVLVVGEQHMHLQLVVGRNKRVVEHQQAQEHKETWLSESETELVVEHMEISNVVCSIPVVLNQAQPLERSTVLVVAE